MTKKVSVVPKKAAKEPWKSWRPLAIFVRRRPWRKQPYRHHFWLWPLQGGVRSFSAAAEIKTSFFGSLLWWPYYAQHAIKLRLVMQRPFVKGSWGLRQLFLFQSLLHFKFWMHIVELDLLQKTTSKIAKLRCNFFRFKHRITISKNKAFSS